MQSNDGFDLGNFLPYLLNQAAEEVSTEFQKIYRDRYGMLRTEWRVLFHLGFYQPMTATDISIKAKVHKTKISRAVHRLEERRFLIRTQSKDDRRQEILTLTTTGMAAYRDLHDAAQNYEAKLLNGLDVQEVERLRSILKYFTKR